MGKNTLFFSVIVLLSMFALAPKGEVGIPKASSSPYEVIVLYPDADALITEAMPDNNYCSFQYLSVGVVSNNKRVRTCIHFDLDQIPEGSTIISAELQLTFAELYLGTGSAEIGVYWLVNGGFDESCVTWNRRTCSEDWPYPGGEYSSAVGPMDTVTVDTSYSHCDVATWDVKYYVEKYVSGQFSANYGFMLTADDATDMVRFYSREGAAGSGCSEDARPKLVVTYTPPSPEYEVNLIQPSGGEVLTAGQTYQIKWEASPAVGKIRIFFSSNGGSTWEMIDCLDNTGGLMTYTWQVPQVESDQCRIKISMVSQCTGWAELYAFDESGLFSIIAPEEADFSIDLSPDEVTVQAGQQASFTITVTPEGGFSATLYFSVSGLPLDASYNLIPTGPYTLTLLIQTGSTTGTFTITVTATGGGKTHSDTATLIIEPPPTTTTPPPTTTAPPTTPPPTTTQPPTTPPPTTPAPSFDFTLSVQPPTVTASPGDSISFAVTVELVSGTAEEVSFTVAGLPSEFRWRFNPPSITPTGVSTLLITVGDNPGTYTFVVTATGGGVTRTATATITVEQAKKCIIATVTYGGELSDEVQLLREYRDGLIVKSFLGKSFMYAFNKFYYSWSPTIASIIDRNEALKEYMKMSLYPLIYILQAAKWLNGFMVGASLELSILAAGIFASTLIGMVYIGPTVHLVGAITGVKPSKRLVYLLVLSVALWFFISILSYLTLAQSAAVITTSMTVLSSVALGSIATSKLLKQ